MPLSVKSADTHTAEEQHEIIWDVLGGGLPVGNPIMGPGSVVHDDQDMNEGQRDYTLAVTSCLVRVSGNEAFRLGCP